jgi:hypothetical protein
MSRIPNIRYPAGDYRSVVTFLCNVSVVERLKATIPSYNREWSPSQKHWLIAPFYIAEFAAVLRAVYGECLVEELPAGTAEPTPIRGERDLAFRELHLMPTAPVELVEASYCCLARLHHPDRGGSDARMRRLNEAVEVLRERRAAS